MNTIKKLFCLIVLVLFFTGLSHAQAVFYTTTMSAAISSTTTSFQVASVTNMTAINPPVSQGTVLYVDREAMNVQSVNTSTKTVSVIRGWAGTAARAHAISANINYGPANYFGSRDLSGGCTASATTVAPEVNVVTGQYYYCYDGTWQQSPFNTIFQNATGRFTYSTVPIGSVAYSSFGNESAMTAGSAYCADVVIPRNVTLTGIGVLIGTTGTTDNWLTILYDAAGNLVANSATAGALVGTASTIQKFAFTGTVAVEGPAKYYACVQSNGTHATLATVAANTFTDVLTTSSTGVFGTIPATITVPTTFTANVGPIAYVY